MVSLGALPALQLDTNLLSGTSGINSFRQGEQDQIGHNQRNLLKQVGGQAATGNYLEAAKTAMRGGDLDTGLSLTKHKAGIDANDTETRLKLFDLLGRGADGAETPEKWDALVNFAQGIYGPKADLSQYRDFNKRDQIRAFLSNSKSELERQKLQTEIELSREKLTGEREERGFKREMLGNFGLMPQGASSVPSYSPPTGAGVPPTGGAAPAPTGDATAGFAAAPSAAQPPPMTPPTGTSAPVGTPQSLQDAIAKLQPAQRAMFGLLVSKGDYAGANKLLQDASGDVDPKPPSGYEWGPDDPETGRRTQRAIAGGPASKLPSDVAGKVGMMRVAMGNLPNIRNIFLGKEGDIDPKTGKPTRKGSSIGMIDYYATAGEIGEGIRLTTGAIESVLRAASGAAVPEQEVTRYQGLFLPSPYDTEITKQRKLDALENWISNMLATIQEGRPVPLNEAHQMAQGGGKPSGRLPAGQDDVLQQARDAIARGADPAAVRKRLQDNGIDASGL